jgi:hypothetical protein
VFDARPGADPLVSVQVEDESTHIADPLADLLLSVAAIIVLAVIAIFPTIRSHSTLRDDEARRVVPAKVNFRLHGLSIDPFVAIGQGLVVGADSSRVIPVDRIFLDDGLAGTLERMRAAGKDVVLLIEPDGFETAFQFEVMANRHGAKRMHQIRLESECNIDRYCHHLVRPSGDGRR